MADGFMKIKNIIIPFLALAIMASQLAGCAAGAGDERIKNGNEVPDADLLHEEELEELSHDELFAVFEQMYEVSKEIENSDSEETIQSELLMVEITAASMERSLPADYEAQYREWRPSVVPEDAPAPEAPQQTPPEQSQPEQIPPDQGSAPPQPQGGSPDAGEPYENPNIVVNEEDRGTVGWPSNFQVTTDPSEIASGNPDPYDGYGEVSIGYGENADAGGHSGVKTHKPGGIMIVEE